MTTILKLKELGESLGYKDVDLQTFIKEQQAEERSQRNLDRKYELERMANDQRDKDRENLDRQYEAQMQADRTKLELERMANEQKDKDREFARFEIESRRASLDQRINDNDQNNLGSTYTSQGHLGPKLPYFEDGVDDMDAYLFRFERVAEIQSWKREDWAIYLSSLLKGKSLEVYSRLSAEQTGNYDALKKALLRRYDLTEDGFKNKFRTAKPEKNEAPDSFLVRLQSYLQRWVELSETEQTYEGLSILLVMEQYVNGCSKEMALFLKERTPRDLRELSDLAQQYMDAHGERGSYSSNRSEVDVQASKTIKSCFNCGRAGHFSTECRDNYRSSKSAADWKGVGTRDVFHQRSTYPKSGKSGCWNCGKPGHVSRNCMQTTKTAALVATGGKDRNDRNSCESRRFQGETSSTPAVQGCSGEHGAECRISCGCRFPVIVDACRSSNCQVGMPVVEGFLNQTKVSVLRDTGCSTVVVRRSLVQNHQLIGSDQRCVLIDGTIRVYPVAEIDIKTPYYTGIVKALCMKKPLYDIIIGNVQGAKGVGDLVNAAAVVTRSQRRQPAIKPLTVMKSGVNDISVEVLEKMQHEDESLQRILTKQQNTIDETDKKKFMFSKKGHLWYKNTVNKNFEVQLLLVPTKLRNDVLKIAHEGIMSGHQAAKRTLDRILSAFWWPGIHADVSRYCRSCDICQRTAPKGRTSKVPLGQVPIIQTPFQRVAIDLVGPMSPVTDRGHRYVLTVVDYATRYPEAEVLKNVETETVAEALITIFSRVGVPSEVLSDQGGQFVGHVMKEVSRLLSIRQLVTTPYHPQCNGLVERFNGTLKAMLKKVAAERPKDWDRYIPALLFAYREVPQESLGFSPFEMLYGRTVRGPMQILKELWTKEFVSDEVKSTYQYVLDLKERLQETCELAHQNLKESRIIQKKYFDAKARDRVFATGEKVLLLLPTENSKLLMHWQGPYEILERCGPCDYRVQLPTRAKMFHANMLKKYWDREIEKSENVKVSKGITEITGAVILEPMDEVDDEVTPLETMCSQQTETFEDVKISSSLSPDQHLQVKALLQRYQDIFTDVPKICKLGHHEINLASADPIVGKGYPIPHAMRPAMEAELNLMIDMNIIEPSTAAYSSPVVLVKKSDGSTRVCVDYRRLNRITVFDPEPMPNVDGIFAKLAGDRFFSKFDLCKGFWQIPMREEDKDLTTFVCHKGLFRFRVMPFGLVNAPATFTRIMRRLVQEIESLDNYLDDVLVHNKVWEAHLNSLKAFFDRVRKANIALKPSKCTVGEFDVSFLGFQIGEGTLKPKIETVSRILDAPRPTTKKQVRAFVGLIGFYRNFIPNFAALASPLTDLTKKGTKTDIEWGEPQQRAFTTLKACMVNPPVLKLPDLGRTFILQTDASNIGIGAVMLQEGEDRIKHPVAFASRKLLPREKNYSTIERECLAIIWAIGKFQQYLYGTEFILETDHQPLQYLGAAQYQNGRLMRWALALQPYRFVLRAIRGKDNVGADFLSRHPC